MPEVHKIYKVFPFGGNDPRDFPLVDAVRIGSHIEITAYGCMDYNTGKWISPSSHHSPGPILTEIETAFKNANETLRALGGGNLQDHAYKIKSWHVTNGRFSLTGDERASRALTCMSMSLKSHFPQSKPIWVPQVSSGFIYDCMQVMLEITAHVPPASEETQQDNLTADDSILPSYTAVMDGTDAGHA